MNLLYLIPARGGSKGIPHKNIKLLCGKPLITYSIDVARQLTDDQNICVSTDDEKIIQTVTDYGLAVPFKRPVCLATDSASTYDVLLHAIKFYENLGKQYDGIVLLQPTTRQSRHCHSPVFYRFARRDSGQFLLPRTDQHDYHPGKTPSQRPQHAHQHISQHARGAQRPIPLSKRTVERSYPQHAQQGQQSPRIGAHRHQEAGRLPEIGI